MALGDIVPWRRGGLRCWERVHSSLLPEVWAPGEIVPQLDVTENEKAFSVQVELPGLDEKDVEVTLSDRLLTIRGEKKADKKTKEKDYYRRERAYGTFRRSIEIPVAVDAAKIEGELVTSIINPSHELAPGYRADEVSIDGESLMTLASVNDVMTVQQLIDLVAFLQGRYEVVPPQHDPYGYVYP